MSDNQILMKTDILYVKIASESHEVFQKNIRLSAATTAETVRSIQEYFKVSGLDGQGMELIFDIGSDGKIMGIEILL